MKKKHEGIIELLNEKYGIGYDAIDAFSGLVESMAEDDGANGVSPEVSAERISRAVKLRHYAILVEIALANKQQYEIRENEIILAFYSFGKSPSDAANAIYAKKNTDKWKREKT